MAREQSICSYVVYQAELVVIGDIARDPRFQATRTCSKTGALLCRCAAGRSQGYVLGCFAIMDDQPRNMSDDDMALLSNMAEQLMQDIRETRRQSHADKE